jgi:hypothetical protein
MTSKNARHLDPKMFNLLMAAIGGRATIIGYVDDCWRCGTPHGGAAPEELRAFLSKHHDRLRALLDKPVLLNFDWRDGDAEVMVSIIPAGANSGNERFKTFRLPF